MLTQQSDSRLRGRKSTALCIWLTVCDGYICLSTIFPLEPGCPKQNYLITASRGLLSSTAGLI